MRAAVIAALLCATAASAVAGGRCEFENGRIAFGSIEATQGQRRDAIGEIAVACTGGGDVMVTISLLEGGDLRHLGLHRAPLFVLYLDPAHQQTWGDGRGNGEPVRQRVTADGRPVRIPVYGGIQATESTQGGDFRRDLSLEVVVDPISSPP